MQKNQVLWISHRGYHAQAVENTAAAFDAAVAAGFTHLETDLRCTLDGHIVLNHDPDLVKTCKSPLLIEHSRWNDLQALRTRDGQTLLSFEDFIDYYAGFSWTFDIKPETARTVITGLLTWVKGKKAESWFKDQARFLCWSRKDEQYLLQVFPRAKTLARSSACYRAGLAVLTHLPWMGGIQSGKVYALPRFFAGCDLYARPIAEAYQRRGARVLAYLPERDDDAMAALDAGFDEVLTNFLPLSLS